MTDKLPTTRESEDATTLPENWGRMGHLTPGQSAACTAFSAQHSAALGLTKYPSESLENAALRFLRARKFDLDATAALLAKCNEMKQQGGAHRYAALSPDECARCNVAALQNFYPHTMSGFDKQNRPILWEISGALNVPAIQTICHKETLMAYHWWTMETKVRHAYCMVRIRVRVSRGLGIGFGLVYDLARLGQGVGLAEG